MRFVCDESHTDETEDVFRVAVVANSTSENRFGVGDVVFFDVLGRITIGETFESESGQKVQRFPVFQQRSTASNFDYLNT